MKPVDRDDKHLHVSSAFPQKVVGCFRKLLLCYQGLESHIFYACLFLALIILIRMKKTTTFKQLVKKNNPCMHDDDDNQILQQT